MPTEQKKDDRRPNTIGMKFSLLRFRDLCSEGSSVSQSKEQPCKCWLHQYWHFLELLYSISVLSSEQSAFRYTFGFLVNQPILTTSVGCAKAGGGPRTLRRSHSPCFFMVNPEGRMNSFPVESLM